MRTKLLIPLVGFMLLLTVVSCTDPMDVNPNYNAETKEVNTKFVISVNTGSPQTKMLPDEVQQNNNFRGINDGHILLFKSYDGATPTPSALPYVLDKNLVAEKNYPFGVLMSSGDITANLNQTESSNRILQMSIPTGVNTVLIYGKAPEDKAYNEQGHIIYSISETPANISFSLARRIGDTADDITAYDQTGALMVFVINRILSSSCVAQTSPAYMGYSPLDAISWRELGILYEYNNHLHGTNTLPSGMTARSLTALEEGLGRAYSEFTYIKDGEYRSGSSNAIKKMMQDMYSVITSTMGSTPGSAREANAVRLANKIDEVITYYFDGNWKYREISDIHVLVVQTLSLMDESVWVSQFEKAKDLNLYPYGDFNIPEGAAQLTFNRETGVMGYMHPNQALLNAGKQYDPRNYTYPAEIVYCVNSPLRISSKNGIQVSDFVNGVTPWTVDANWTAKGWNAGIGAVEQSTRGVAVRDNISYGVALLESNVSFGEDFTSYEDNRKAMTGEANRTFTKADAKLSLKGVLVGGQNGVMDWQFLAKNTVANPTQYAGADTLIDPSLFNRVVYDDKLNSAAIPTEAGKPNYTLVFDNYTTDNEQNKVKVALEFVNGGDAFWGKDNLIPAGGTFYLVGELDPANPKTGSAVDWASATRQIPPIYLPGETIPTGKNAGDSKQIARVFIQDYKTVANFKLKHDSLQNAYFTVPDLRSSQLSFGLSVDLEWKTGYIFDVNL